MLCKVAASIDVERPLIYSAVLFASPLICPRLTFKRADEFRKTLRYPAILALLSYENFTPCPSKLGFGAILKRMRAASFADIWNDLFSGNKIRFERAINTMIY